nr:helix-turn-helix transcriptional regulator [Sedimentibacter sp.]
MAKMKNVMLKIEETKETMNQHHRLDFDVACEILENSDNEITLLNNSFVLGYLQGIKAEKARQKSVKLTVNLTELRGNKTQEEVAKDLGVSISALTAYENAERIPRDELKLKIAEYYNMSVRNIFN